MSFKDVIKDFTQSDVVLNAEAIRRQAGGFLVGGIGLMAIFIIYAIVVYLSDDPTIALQVFYRSDEIAETNLLTPDGAFNIGRSGVLHYQPKTFLDFFIFSSFGLFNVIDFAFIMYTGIILFNALKTVNEQDTFQTTISIAYKKVGRTCIWMFALKTLYEIFLRKYFHYRASDNLWLNSTTGFYEICLIYIFFGGIISSFAYFMNKGIALQEEKDLTI